MAEWFAECGCTGRWPLWLGSWSLALGYIIVAVAFYWVLNNGVNPLIQRLTRKTETKIDDILFREEFLRWVWWLLSALLLKHLLEYAVSPYRLVSSWVEVVMDVVIIGFGTKALVEFVEGLFLVVFDSENIDKEAERIHSAEENDVDYEYVPSHSLKGLQQMICIVIWGIGAILMLAALIGRSPLLIVSGLGAGAAILMLVFKDSILGVVAGIQLTANDMLRPGDWIMAPAHGANGVVKEVTLATVKVVNWDHTIVTIPPYLLVSQSFQNWRNMKESGGRRVMRSFNIDMTTVRFMSKEERARFDGERWAEGCVNEEEVANITLFRHYLKHYISTLPTLRRNMLYMVRELQPTPQGLPIEIYFFTSKTGWEAYEMVQAAALDHILAVVSRFGLRLFQSPTGADLASVAVR